MADPQQAPLDGSLLAGSDVSAIVFCPRPLALLCEQACLTTTDRSFAPERSLISAASTSSNDRCRGARTDRAQSSSARRVRAADVQGVNSTLCRPSVKRKRLFPQQCKSTTRSAPHGQDGNQTVPSVAVASPLRIADSGRRNVTDPPTAPPAKHDRTRPYDFAQCEAPTIATPYLTQAARYRVPPCTRAPALVELPRFRCALLLPQPSSRCSRHERRAMQRPPSHPAAAATGSRVAAASRER